MPRPQSWNPVKLTAELSASDDAINPLLAASNITSIKVDGKDVPASEAPLQHRIAAYASVIKAGVTDSKAVELAELNGQITAQLEKLQDEHALAQSSVATLTQEKSKLSADLATSTASVTKLTADNAELGNRNNILAKELESNAGRLNSQKLALTKKCVAHGAVELKGKDGKSLTATAPDADLADASKELTFEALLDAHCGALNAAATKLGVNLGNLPTTAATVISGAPKLTRKELEALSPKEQSAFFAAKGQIITA